MREMGSSTVGVIRLRPRNAYLVLLEHSSYIRIRLADED